MTMSTICAISANEFAEVVWFGGLLLGLMEYASAATLDSIKVVVTGLGYTCGGRLGFVGGF